MKKHEIKQARMLRDWWSLLAKNANGWRFEEQGISVEGKAGPNMQSDLSKFTINPPKPKLKDINLSVCIESKVDMEFQEENCPWYTSKLTDIRRNVNSSYKYREATDGAYTKCRVRQDHCHFWSGGDKCPLPEGLEIMLKFRSRARVTTTSYSGYAWKHIGGSDDVIGFKVLGAAEGWKYPWEKDE